MKITLASLNIDASSNYDPIYFPIGLSCLIPILEKCNLEVTIFDINTFFWKKDVGNSYLLSIAEEILKNSPSYIEFYTRSDLLPRVLICAEKIKKLAPHITIILGGPGAYLIETDIMKSFQSIDIIVRGEGELTIQELFEEGVLKRNLYSIKGIFFRDNENIIKNEDRELIENLDILPMPKRLFSKKEIGYQQKEEIFIEAGRGCPYNCSFCTTSMFWNRKYRIQSPKRLLDEIEYLTHHQYNIFSLMHDNLLVSEEYVEELALEFKKRNINIEWHCSARVDNINENKIKLIKECGCNKIYFGIETGSKRMQKIIGKNLDISMVDYAINLCDKYEIFTTKSFIIGFQEETIDDINDTLLLAIKVSNCKFNQNVQIHYLQPSPGTRVTTNARKDLVINSEKEISFFLNRNENLYDSKEMDIIIKFPNIFSDFYHINLNLNIDLFQLSFCFSHLIFYYPKTLNIICNNKKITPVNLFSLFKKHYKECNNCLDCAQDYAWGGNGFCKNPLLFLEDAYPLSSMEKYFINYETNKRNQLVEKRINQINYANFIYK